jgi:hypothetical protein
MTKFKLDTSEIKGKNKRLLYETLHNTPDGSVVRITTLTNFLRQQGAEISEASVERYLRFLKVWDWGIEAESLGKCKYLITKLDKKI